MRSSVPLEFIEERVEILSEGLRLEGRLCYPDSSGLLAGAALVLPAHPFLGGDMNGSVVKAVTSKLASRGFMTLTFNYRGIGESQTHAGLGTYQKQFWESSTSPAYEEKIFIDAASAFGFLSSAAGANVPSAVVGYSFGSLPALELACGHDDIRKLCLVSPPVAKWGLDEHATRCVRPKAFFYSSGDFACPEAELRQAYSAFSEPKSIFRFESSGHFYLGLEDELAEKIFSFLAGA